MTNNKQGDSTMLLLNRIVGCAGALMLALVMTLAMAAPALAQTVTFFHNDASGTPLVATDAAGNVAWKENYRPYGDRLNNQAASANNKLWFAGKPYDASAGLSYMGARYYDPVIGRFAGTDPESFNPDNVHSFNRYAYANDNPYKFVDPDGKSPALVVEIGVPLLVGGAIHYATQTPEQQQAMRTSLGRFFDNLTRSESSSSNGQGHKNGAPLAAGTDGKKPSLLDPQGEKHILDGDGPNAGGGHRHGTGKPGKSEFPANWSDDKIKGEVSDVATDPGSARTTQPNGRINVQGTRDGVDITVIVEPSSRGGRIVTGFPTNTPRNPP